MRPIGSKWLSLSERYPSLRKRTASRLKGGTAINLFVRGMPRLSVDIDLTYLPVLARAASLTAIDAASKRIAGRLRPAMPGALITALPLQPEQVVTKLLVRAGDAQIKIEVTPVMRGCVYAPELRGVSPAICSTCAAFSRRKASTTCSAALFSSTYSVTIGHWPNCSHLTETPCPSSLAGDFRA